MVFFFNLQPTMFISNVFICKLCFSQQEQKEIDRTEDILFGRLICPCFLLFNNSQFEQILQIHGVSKKSLCPTKTKVKILDPGNIRQNKLQMQHEKLNALNAKKAA